MKKILSVFTALLLVFLCGCNMDEKNSIRINFLDYGSEEVFDIEEIDLSRKLRKNCLSYKFTYLSEGYKIKAYISIPMTVVEKADCGKAILYNRGGNSNIGLIGDEDTAKICIATNRIVVASQYRGADGSEGKDEFGGDDLKDIIKLIDLCESEFSFIKMEDFCALGVSRGGMMSYMAARQDSRIKRIIAVSAVSDLFSSYEEREDMKTVLNTCIGCSPEISPDEYENRSAVCWANELTLPVLIIHSREDEQVSFTQAEDLYEELQKYNEDVTFIIRDDGVHGLTKDDSQTVSEWLTADK